MRGAHNQSRRPRGLFDGSAAVHEANFDASRPADDKVGRGDRESILFIGNIYEVDPYDHGRSVDERPLVAPFARMDVASARA